MPRSKQKTWTSQDRLEELIAEATVDCYGEYEQHIGLRVAVTDSVQCPFTAQIIGEKVEVLKLTDNGEAIIATCRKPNTKKTYRVEIMSLEFTDNLPKGYEWIETYREWRKYNH